MLNDILKKLREQQNITQKDLAAHLSVSTRLISYYESGQRIPPADILIKIADFFDVSVDYLLGRTNIKNFIQNNTGNESICIKDLSPESKEDLKKWITLLKLRDTQNNK